MRFTPKNIDELRLVLNDQPGDRHAEAAPDTGVSAKTVDELRSLVAWPAGLVVTVERENYPEITVKISKSSQ
jgi:hypothetical protein